MLTLKQEKFVQNIMLGMNQADAYRASYNAKNMCDNAIYREASLLLENPKVTQRLKELRDQLANESIMSAQKRMEWLTSIVNATGESTGDRLKAVDILNKMSGEYVQKVQADVDTDVTVTVVLGD